MSASGDQIEWPCEWPECYFVGSSRSNLREHFDATHLLTSLGIHTGVTIKEPRVPEPEQRVCPVEQLIIEPLTGDNVGELSDLETQWLAEDPFARQSGAVGTLTTEDYLARIEHQQGGGFLARIPPGFGQGDDREAVGGRGQVVAFILHSTDQHEIVTFEKLFVKSEYRKLGVATKIAELSVETLRLRATWPVVVRLIVALSNMHAIHMYQKYGLRPVNAITNYYGDGLHALAMQIVVNGRLYKAVLKAEDISSSLAMTFFSHGGKEICPVTCKEDGTIVVHDCPLGNSLLSADEDRSFVDALALKKLEFSQRLATSRKLLLVDAPGTAEIMPPEHARLLIDEGNLVTIETSTRYPRPVGDEAYIIEGCTIVPSGSWIRLHPSDPTVLLAPENFLELVDSARQVISVL